MPAFFGGEGGHVLWCSEITLRQRQKYDCSLANKTCWVVKWKIAQIPRKQKQNIFWKQIRNFSTTIECDKVRNAGV